MNGPLEISVGERADKLEVNTHWLDCGTHKGISMIYGEAINNAGHLAPHKVSSPAPSKKLLQYLFYYCKLSPILGVTSSMASPNQWVVSCIPPDASLRGPSYQRSPALYSMKRSHH